MLRRCQQTLCRGLLAAVQHQQQCLQLEVLSELQLVRNKSSSGLKGGRRPMTARQRSYQLEEAARNKALERIDPTPSAASLAASLKSTPAPSAAAAAPTAAEDGSDTARSASSSSSTTDSSSESSATSWRPAWLDRLMDYPRLRRPAPARPSPLQEDTSTAAAATTAAAAAEDVSSTDRKDKNDKEWQEVRKQSNISLDEYQTKVLVYGSPERLKEAYDTTNPDIPTRPPQLGNPNAPLFLKMDHRRIKYARQKLHYEIISSLSAEDKALASQHLDSCIKDQDWLKRVAQVAQKQPGMVLDLLRQIKRHRSQYTDLARHKELGGEINDLDDEKEWAEVLGRMKKKRLAEAAARVLVNRDPDSCELRKWYGVMMNKVSTSNRRVQCPKTGLPYSECCGALFGGRHLKGFRRKQRQQRRQHA